MGFVDVTDQQKQAAAPEVANVAQPGKPVSGRFKEVTEPDAIKRFDQVSETQGVEPVNDGKDAGLWAATVTGFGSDRKEMVQYLASEMFPNEPMEQSVKRFGDRDGRIVYRADDGKLYNAQPIGYWPPRQAAGAVLHGLGNTLPYGAGGAAAIGTAPMLLTGPAGMAGSMSITGAAAGAGDVARQAVGDFLMGDASTNDIDLKSAASEAGMAALGQGIGAGLTGLAQKGAVRDLSHMNPAATSNAFYQARQAAVDITPAEATGLKSLAQQQKRFSNLPATADTMDDFYNQRDKQVVTSFQRFLDSVSGATDAENIGRLGRTTAKGILGDIKDATRKAAKPLYDAAFEEGDKAIWSPKMELLSGSKAVKNAMTQAVDEWGDDAIADGFGAANPRAIVEGDILKFRTGGMPAYPNLQFWDYTKRNLDRAANIAASAGDNAKARTLGNIARQLRTELDEIVPGKYAQARKAYGTGAENLETAMESALGILAETKDTNVLAAAKHIFNPKTRSPQMVLKLRNAIESKDRNAWQAMKRLFMQDAFDDALRISEQGEILNPAGKIFKAFSSKKLRSVLNAAMTQTERDHFDLLRSVYKRAASVPRLRSDTAYNTADIDEAFKGSRPALVKIFRNINPAQALRSFDEWATGRSMDKNARAVAEIVTSGDSASIAAMRELRKLSPSDVRFRVVLGHVLSNAGRLAISELIPGTNREPEKKAN